MDDHLPNGWVTAELGDILEVIRGVTYTKDVASKQPQPDMLPILRATNIGSVLNFDDPVYVPQELVSDAQRLRPGDIVIAASSGSRSVVGKAAQLLSDWNGSFGAFCFGLRPRNGVEPRFVAYFLHTKEYRNRVSTLAAGVNINNLRREHIESTPIPLPPLPEQRRIVTEIETQFTRLDAAAAALERARANLKRYRTAVIDKALSGELSGVTPASEWQSSRLTDVIEFMRNGVSAKPDAESGTRILRISAVRPRSVNSYDVRYLSTRLGDFSDYFLTSGDLLFTRYNGNPHLVGVCAMVRDMPAPTVLELPPYGGHSIIGHDAHEEVFPCPAPSRPIRLSAKPKQCASSAAVTAP